ncbi:hypothetical protein [Kingella oralis]|nr:hypothetical protein [Kingella oralis]
MPAPHVFRLPLYVQQRQPENHQPMMPNAFSGCITHRIKAA